MTTFNNSEMLVFTVRDTGVGIPQKVQEKIFESFTQADRSTTRQYGGTGLGLAISKRLVGMMGGQLSLQSEVGEGTKITATGQFPHTEPIQKSETFKSNNLKNTKILVVDDNVTNRFIYNEILTHLGAIVDEVESGELALEKLHEADRALSPYQIVLLDFNMPKCDGLQVAEKMSKTKYRLPPSIIMLTSSDQLKDKKRAKQLHLHDYLTKPVKKADLVHTIKAAMNHQKQPSPDSLRPSTQNVIVIPAIRILLAEHIQANCKIIELYLKQTPATIEFAQNGLVAVEKFRRGKYDLVLMDIQMPIMDGHEATRKIRKWESEKGMEPTPIVALTAHAFQQHRQECFDAGCTGFMSKPIKKNILLEKLSALFPVA